MELQAMTTQTRPTMPLTVGMPASIRRTRNSGNQTSAPRNDRTGAYLQTARTLAADHTPPGQEPAVGGIFQGRIKSMSNI